MDMSDTPYTNAEGSAPLNPTEETPTLMVHVTAPASLQAGYTFEAEINGDPDKVFTCQVPQGGVTEGQVFLTPLPLTFDGLRLRAPVGHWKDGLCDCCALGVCHPTLWCALCCTQIAMGQIMSRMQLTWLGEYGPIASTANTFRVVVLLVASYYAYSTCLLMAELPYATQGVPTPTSIAVLKFVGSFVFSVWAVYSLCRVRENVRARYQIPETRCAGCEDLCCSLWCSCCVTSQMLRHTGEHETYPAVCCTRTGHPPGTPIVV